MMAHKWLVSCLLVLVLMGCEEVEQTVPTYSVEMRDFAIQLSGFGEIEAAQAQRIVSPGTRPMTISWLADENTLVEKGDVIAKFDAEQLLKDSRTEELQMALLQQDIEQSMAQREQLQNEIVSEQTFVGHEYEFADKFAIDDLRVYSKLEIIDSIQNRDFLGAKEHFLEWKESSIDEQNDSEMDVLAIKRKGHETKYQRHQEALSQLQVFAPYAGLLTYEKDRQGEKPAVGQTVFPGRVIARIPNLDNMQARVFVLAKDAIDLAAGVQVTVRLDAYPERTFAGTVDSVSGFPRSIERGNPVTYYEVVVALNEQDKTLMQPGRKLTAQINVQQTSKKLIVPLQAIHHQQGRSFVYVKSGLGFVQKDVTTNQKNLYFVEVVTGLQEGDEIALSVPHEYLFQFDTRCHKRIIGAKTTHLFNFARHDLWCWCSYRHVEYW